MKIHEWRNHLLLHPEDNKGCPWDEFDLHEWNRILLKHPQLSDYCPWKDLLANNWNVLFLWHPQMTYKLIGTQFKYLVHQEIDFICTSSYKRLVHRKLN